jgi:hypothetical protein
MIQRHQRIVFWCLVACIVGMAILLWAERQRGRDRVQALGDTTLLDAPAASTETVTFDLANDADGTIAPTARQIALPSDANARARALIDHLIAEYALPGSAHALPAGSAVDEVFLLPLPIVGHTIDSQPPTIGTTQVVNQPSTAPIASTDPNAIQPQTIGGQLAVIDLRSTFVNQHPSGVEVESLTLLSILGTLHANLPQIEQVRFLVDGQPRETLAGHADLLRSYPSRDTTVAGRSNP